MVTGGPGFGKLGVATVLQGIVSAGCALAGSLVFATISLLAAALLAGPASPQEAASLVRSMASPPLTAKELVEVRGLSGLAVSPDGEYAVVRIDWQRLDRNDTDLTWQVVRLRTGDSWPLADAGDPLWGLNGGLAMETPQWSTDGRWVYFRALRNQEVQVWRASLDGSHVEQLTHDASDVLAFIAGDKAGDEAGDGADDGADDRADDRGVLHYVSAGATRAEIIAAEGAEYDTGVLIDRTILPGLPVVRSFPVNGRMATYRRLLPSSIHFGRATLLGDRPIQAKTLDLETLHVRAAGADVAARFANWWTSSSGGLEPFDPGRPSVSISPDAKKRAEVRSLQPAASDTTRGSVKLAWRRNGQKDTACQHAVCRASDSVALVGWASDREIVFQTDTFSRVGLHVWNIERDTVKTLASNEGVLGSHASGLFGACELARGAAICLASEANIPPRLVAIDIAMGRTRVVFDPNGSLTPDRLGSVETITLADRFGNGTFARLILPSDAPRGERIRGARLPLVITSYTCDGFLMGGSGQDVPEHVLAGMGYASLCVDTNVGNVRRSPAYKPAPETSNQSTLDFFENAIAVLDKQGIIDPDRVVLSGFSGSASATAYSLTKSRKVAAAIITTQTALDPMDYYLSGLRSGQRWIFEERGYKPPYDTPENPLFRETSTAWNADRIRAPLLMQLADVEYVSMMQLFTTMTDLGRGVEMHVFPDEYHTKRQPRHRLAVYERNTDWVNFWLRGVESADPSREQQNIRWRAIKDKQCKLFGGDAGIPDRPWYCLPNPAPKPASARSSTPGG